MRAAFLAQLRLEEVKYKITTNFDLDEGEGGYNKGSGTATDFPDTDFDESDGNFNQSQ